MIERSRSRLATAIAAAGLIVGVASARAGDIHGPEIGSGKVDSVIESLTDRPDTDDYTAELMPGETLSVTVSAAKKSSGRFDVMLFDPAGNDRTFDGKFKSKKDGAKVQVKSVPIDVVGRWAVRIVGKDGTEGGYGASFKVTAAKPFKIKKQTLAGSPGSPAARVHDFGAIDGSTLSLKLSWGKKDAPVVLRDLRGPLGTLPGVFGEDDDVLQIKATSVSLKNRLIELGTGDHAIEVASEGTATYSLSVKVAAPARPGGKRTIHTGNDPHLDTQEVPVRSAAGHPVRITGRNFSLSPLPSVFFGPFRASVAAVGGAREYLDVIVPAGEDGSTQDLVVVNADGQSAYHDAYIVYVPEAVIESVAHVSGAELGDGQVTRAGGDLFQVTGRHFTSGDVAMLNDSIVTKQAFTSTGFQLALPAGASGLVTLRLTDGFGRVQTVVDIARRVGFDESTASTLPAMSQDDDWSAWDGAIGDLDNDFRVDDLVIATYNANSRVDVLYGPDDDGIPPYYIDGLIVSENPVGDRAVYTRMFFRQSDGRLTDQTDALLPAAGDDARGHDDLNALAVAIGDINGDDVNDIVLGGSAGAGDTSSDFNRVRVLVNSGSGRFTHANLRFDPMERPELKAYDETYNPNASEPTGIRLIAGPRVAPRVVTALAIGDLDGDGDLEVVAGAPDFATRSIRYDQDAVDFTQNPPYINSADLELIDFDGRTYYYSATQVFDNAIADSNGMVDVTPAVLPSVGTEADAGHVAFRARHLVLGDIDQDDDLDLLVTWSNPASLIPRSAERSFGGYPKYSSGVYQHVFDADTAEEVAATRVLLNDGDGVFSDATDTWLPATGIDEYWHAYRMLLADLDGDTDLDLVLLHRRALNAYRYLPGVKPPSTSRPSLRILRNDGDAFVDVTATALPAEIVGEASQGGALAVGDIDLDGKPEIVFGATPDPDAYDDFNTANNRKPPFTRVLWNRGGLRFEIDDDFVLPASVDSGEVHALLIGDPDRDGLPGIHLLGENLPENSAGGTFLRIHEWQR